MAASAAVVGQERAVQSLTFGIGIKHHGYNLFAVGPPGVGKLSLLRQFLEQRASDEPVPRDWCYVYDFANPDRPRAIELPPGKASGLQRDMAAAVAELRVAMRATFESEEYRTRKQQIGEHFKTQQERALAEVQERARQHDVAVVQTGTGIAIAPIRNGETIDATAFAGLPADERRLRQAAMERVGAELEDLLRRFQRWAREHYEEARALDRAMATATTRQVINGVRRRYDDLPAVIAYLAEVEIDVIDNAEAFLESSQEGMEAALRRALRQDRADGAFRRYHVNVLVDRSRLSGAPVVHEDNPTHANLVGSIEHETQFGALVTNFTLIKAGSLHRAIGGYLMLDALKVLQSPFAWEALKRAVRSGEIRIESLGRSLGLVATVSLEPAAVPLGSTKLVLFGERQLYYLLAALDPEFLELFKVLVDFEETMDRRPAAQQTYATLVAALVAKERLRPFDRSAVARVIEHAARMIGDATRLSVQMRPIVDLLREADYWAGQAHREITSGADVEAAIEAQRLRSGRVRQHLRDAMLRDDLLISTTGASAGQVNGLSVVQLGDHLFGHPTRITASARLGEGKVIDIEREVKLGGPIHSKGVLILSGYLGARYAPGVPLSLSATLVFEQTYGGVEGDSASLAELCALVSALSGAPLTQSFAVTGSVNQHGDVQGIGGVNEKIEGFFDLCRERGLSGEQGVIIPRTNAKNLMLRREVVDAAADGRFHVHAVGHVDEAVALLAGRNAGARGADGAFPADSVNGLVEARLLAFADRARAWGEGGRNRPAEGTGPNG